MELAVGELGYCFRRCEITDMNRSPLEYSSAHNIASVHAWIFHSAWQNSAIMGYKLNHVTIKAAYNGIVCLTQPCGTFSYGVKHWLQVSWRAGDYAQDLACCGLLLAGLLQFFGSCVLPLQRFYELLA